MLLDYARFPNEEWVKKINNEYREIANKKARENYKRTNSRISFKNGFKKYINSEKGKLARKRCYAARDRNIRGYIISEEEKELIRKFYIDCPMEFDVDHIIPLSKGGKHQLQNLQHLPKHLNRIKNSRIVPPLSEYPHCRIDITYLFK